MKAQTGSTRTSTLTLDGVVVQRHLPTALLPRRASGTLCTSSSVSPMRTAITFTPHSEIQNLKTISMLPERDIKTPGFEPGLSTNGQCSLLIS